MKRFIFLLLPACLSFPANAFQTDSVQIRLITLLPRSDKVYTVYGHTALRISDPAQGIDAVFNWGMFDFDAPNFLYRFVKGETDYFLAYSDYSSFIQSARWGNATVEEQLLNIPPEGKEKILQAVSDNLLPQNRVYRYNFLFDNCTTRVRDLIENGLNGQMTYPESPEEVTFRNLIHSCTEPYPWMTFGIDLLVGNGADSIIGFRRQLFLPVHLKQAIDEAYYSLDGTEKIPVLKTSRRVLTAVPEDARTLKFWDSPMKTGFLLLFMYLVIVITGWRKRRRFRGFFAPLFLLAGAAGSLIGFMVLFSEHPCMSPNWNLLWLHPLHFIGFASYIVRQRIKPVFACYHALNFVFLCGLLMGWRWLPQALNPGDIPYILCLMLGSVTYLCNTIFK